jgi:hypothetical protein
MEKSRQVDEEYKGWKAWWPSQGCKLGQHAATKGPTRLPPPQTHTCIKHAGSRSTAPWKTKTLLCWNNRKVKSLYSKVSAQFIKRSGILATLSWVCWTFYIRAAIGTPEPNRHGIKQVGMESNQRHTGPKACHPLFCFLVGPWSNENRRVKPHGRGWERVWIQ